MYAVRDSEGRVVGKPRSLASAHRWSRRANMAGGAVSRDSTRTKAREIVRWLQLDGHAALPAEILRHWGVTYGQAEKIHAIRASAFGPGGKGEAWATGRVATFLASSNPTKWEHVPEHDAWIKEYHFAAVPGWSRTTKEGVAVRRESKGSKEWRIDRTMFGGGWQAVTSTCYPSAAAAKRDADKIFRVFAAARAKGAEIDIDSMIGNDGQIRWHDTHLGLAGVRREDFNIAGVMRIGAKGPRKSRSEKIALGTVNMVVAMYGDFALYGASTHPGADTRRYWGSALTDEPFALFHAKVPVSLVSSLENHGTSKQVFSDGYEGWKAVAPYIKTKPFYVSHEYDEHAGAWKRDEGEDE